MKVTDRIRMLLLDWGQLTGLYSSANSASSSLETNTEVAHMSEEQVLEKIRQYTGLGHVQDRINKLAMHVNELTDFKKPRKAYSSGDDHSLVKIIPEGH